MTDHIVIPRSTLAVIPSALHRGIFLSMVERADEEGRLTISVRGFADEIKTSYQSVRTVIEKLTTNAIINAIATQRLTQITICNFGNYNTSSRKQSRKANAIGNAIIPQQKSQKFTPPTEAEVRLFVSEQGYHFNPAQFVSHYESKGWKVGKEPMKNWKAACRTWEVTWKERHGEKFYYETQQSSQPSGRGQHRNPDAIDLAREILGNTGY